MSLGPAFGIGASVAGTQLAQTRGTDRERAVSDTTNQNRQAQSAEKAEAASGIGETDTEDTSAHDRDADGRRLWESMDTPGEGGEEAADTASNAPPKAKSTDEGTGGGLDLTI